jgi:hypothetical protein
MSDRYHIPGTEPPAGVQNAEHPSVERRSQTALVIAGAAVLVAVMAAIFSGLQWKAADRQADISDRALGLAEKSAKDQTEDITRSRKAAEDSAAAAVRLAGANASMAETMRNELDAANKQVKVMQQQLETADRPWVKIVDVKPRGNGPEIPSLSFQVLSLAGVNSPKQQAYLNYEVHGKNVGHSTALNIQTATELYLPQWKNGYSNEVQAEEKRFCESYFKGKTTVSNGGPALYPDEPYTSVMGNGGAVVKDSMNFFPELTGGPYIVPVLVGCVDYQFQSSTRHHRTLFVYEMFHAHDPKTRFFLAGQGVKADDLLLIRNDSDDYAN